ncbi:MAG TPA: glycosyltransferase [Patescibacteria group bacterium]|nr:glycosyltransferase [Patescibacteria group bacterium]
MRIAIYSDNFYPELSGITDTILTTAKELAKLGHFINFFVPYYSKKDYKQVNLSFEKEVFLHENIKITRFFSFSYPTGTRQGRLVVPTGLRFLKVKFFNPDIIHTNHIAGVGIEGLIDAKILKKPLIGTNHTPIVEFIKYSPIKAKWFKRAMSKYDAWYFNKCDFVSSPSWAVLHEMQKYGFNRPCKPVSNPVNIETFKSVSEKERNTLKKKYGFSDFVLYYCGRLAQEKHIDLMVKAVSDLKGKIPSINLVIAGKGSEEENLKKLVKELNVEDRVKFFGFLKETKDFVELYNATDLFLMLGTAETQSIVMMQAMATQNPVIGVNSWGIVDYVNEKNGFLIEPNDQKALNEKILYFYKNPDQKKLLGEGGREFAEQFSRQNIAKIWEGIYTDVIKKHGNKR